MECPNCKTANPDTTQFCKRCHATLLYKCPSCGATQRQGGACGKCGVDFAKYAAMLVAQEQSRVTGRRERAHQQASGWRQALLLPVTGGFSLIKLLLRRDP